MLLTIAAAQDYQDLFLAAEQELSIFTGKGDLEYQDDFVAACHHFLTRPNSSLRIACQCPGDIGQCPVIKKIIATPGRKGEILVYDAHAFQGKPYFSLADAHAYRLEIPEQAETILDFTDRDEAERLYSQFMKILSYSTLTLYRPPLARREMVRAEVR